MKAKYTRRLTRCLMRPRLYFAIMKALYIIAWGELALCITLLLTVGILLAAGILDEVVLLWRSLLVVSIGIWWGIREIRRYRAHQ